VRMKFDECPLPLKRSVGRRALCIARFLQKQSHLINGSIGVLADRIARAVDVSTRMHGPTCTHPREHVSVERLGRASSHVCGGQFTAPSRGVHQSPQVDNDRSCDS